MFIGKNSKKAILLRQQDETLFAFVAAEVEEGIRREGLWSQAKSLANGDVGKTEAEYLKLRVQSIKDELTLEQILNKEFQPIQNTQQDQSAEIITSSDNHTVVSLATMFLWIFAVFVVFGFVSLFAILLG